MIERASKWLRVWQPWSELYGIGSSILWGQGLKEKWKIHARVARWLERERKERVRVHLLAHSGARLTDGEGGGKPLHGEVPTASPTLLEQVELAPEARSGRVRVLLEGGINDVEGSRIVDPRTPAEEIRERTERAFREELPRVVEAVFGKFPNATVYLLGYYQILAEQAREGEVEELLKAEGVERKARDEPDLRERAVANTRVFQEESTRWLKRLAEEAGERCVFVGSGIEPDEGMFGRDSLLFHPWSGDPMMKVRAGQCTTALLAGRTGMHCYLASTAHPNWEGARRYAERVIAAMGR